MFFEARGIERLRIARIEKGGHQPGHAARRELTVTLAGQHQEPMVREPLREPPGIRGRRNRIGLAR
jgi:hypothetical protein